MDEWVDTGGVPDDATHTVSYTLSVHAGEQYRLRSVTPLNLPPDARAQFDMAWKMKPGDLYDVEYVQNFIHKNTALRVLDNYAAGFSAAADPQTHQVDLTVTFTPMR